MEPRDGFRIQASCAQHRRLTLNQGLGPDSSDEVEIDFSPLRVSLSTLDPLIERADEVASGLEAPALALENVGGEQSSSEFTAEIAAANGLKIDNLYASSVEEQGSDHVDEDVEDEWSQDSNSGPIWTIPAIGRVSDARCQYLRHAKAGKAGTGYLALLLDRFFAPCGSFSCLKDIIRVLLCSNK